MIRSSFLPPRTLWASFGRALFVALAALFTFVAHGEAGTPPDSLTVEVVKIYPSPGFWTGTIEANQWLDVTVKRSSKGAYKTGEALHIGVAVIRGEKLFNPDTRSLDDHQVVIGRFLTIKTGGSCLRDFSSREFKVDPACIRVDGREPRPTNSTTMN